MKKTLLSLFKDYFDTVLVSVTLSEVVRLIREDKTLVDHTEKFRYYRSQELKAVADREKAVCPCFAVGGRFEKGKRKADIGGWTGLTMVDFDHLPREQVGKVFNRVCGDPHTLLAYATISGEEVRVVCGYELEEETVDTDRVACYIQVFKEVNTYYGQLTGCSFDPACKNSTRLSGLAHDAQVYFQSEAEPFCFDLSRMRKPGGPRTGWVERVVARIREELGGQGVCLPLIITMSISCG